MLKQKYRLKLNQDFIKIYRRGKRIKSNNFTLCWAKLPNFTAWRAGIVLSKQVSKKATIRNLYKRRLSIALRQLWNKLPPPSRALIIVANRTIVTQTFADIKNELARAIRKIY